MLFHAFYLGMGCLTLNALISDLIWVFCCLVFYHVSVSDFVKAKVAVGEVFVIIFFRMRFIVVNSPELFWKEAYVKVVALECWFVGMFIRMMVDCLARLIFFLQCKHFVYLGCSLLSCFAASSTLSKIFPAEPASVIFLCTFFVLGFFTWVSLGDWFGCCLVFR